MWWLMTELCGMQLLKKGNLREVLGKSSGEFMQKKSNNQKKYQITYHFPLY